MKIVISFLIVCVVFLGFTVYENMQLRDGNHLLRIEKTKVENRVTELERKLRTEGVKENRDFFDAFLTYDSTKKRYEQVRGITTDKGFRASFPYESQLSDMDGGISSRLLSQENYIMEGTQQNVVFLNKMVVATTYNDVSSRSVIVMKTRLLKVSGRWVVNDVEFVSSAIIN
ncbi:hypothetical protein [Listeria booriae]|uniref:Uncharacterized protein n=1 Tax=Listeria booriae TaxID=1552123 RepID=A0A841ZXK0_9LIST|nr:hypothetical protein [Listeria booriae]MBC1565047.1 hypothetical protein [Listeria booriae]